MQREHNEDACFRSDELGLYIVADGMGGHAAGEVASHEAIEAAHSLVRHEQELVEAYVKERSKAARLKLCRLMESAIQAATYMVYGIAEQDPEHRGMGTTITSILVVDNLGVVASVGDSRAYLVRDGQALQVTEDHTIVQLQVNAGILTPEEAKDSPRGNVITRAVGPRDYVQVDTFMLPIQVDDKILLCSDGLHGYVGPDEIGPILSACTLKQSCEKFVGLANKRGGKDNISCVAVQVFDS